VCAAAAADEKSLRGLDFFLKFSYERFFSLHEFIGLLTAVEQLQPTKSAG